MLCLNKFQVDKMCRTCRSFEGLKSLYDYYITDICLAEMLTLCTPVKYRSEDELPKQICQDCVIEVERSYKFALKCKESNEMFRKQSNKIAKMNDVNHVQIFDCVNKDNISNEIEFVHCPDISSELCEQKYKLSTYDSLSTVNCSQVTGKQEHLPDDHIKIELKSEMIPIETNQDAFDQHHLYNQNESIHESNQMTHLHDSIDIYKVKVEDSDSESESQRCRKSSETEYSSIEFQTKIADTYDNIAVGNSAIDSTNHKKYDFRQPIHQKQTANDCEFINKSRETGMRGTENVTNPSIQYPHGTLQIISIDPDELCKHKQLKTLDVPSDIEEAAHNATSSVISKDSKAKYDLAYEQFEKWCADTNVVDIDERVLLDYFEGKKTLKASTLWTHYSMLRMELSLRRNIDIKKYTSLLAFLKRQQNGYHAKKSNVLSKENISKFLIDADDNIFLMAKVAMIIGIAGACRKAELTYLRVEDVVDEHSYFRVNISNPKTKRDFVITMGNFDGIQFIELIRKYIRLRPPKVKHNRFFIKYSDGKCGVLPVGINTFGNLPKTIAQSIGLPNPVLFTGHCFRRSSVTLLADSGAALLKIKRKGYPIRSKLSTF